jgi:uncharacterized protein YdhG (YjbR/CyaY superfamily)
MNTLNNSDIDRYIAGFPRETQILLEKIRTSIRAAAPNAEEVMSYGIPTFQLHGNLVHFAGYRQHIGFYPAPSGIAAFKKELSVYKGAKGSVQFSLEKPLPLALISRIVKFRVKENIEKFNAKNTKICPQGHQYVKSSDCPVCPVCEKNRKPTEGFMVDLSAPARRALENKGWLTLKKVAAHSESELLALHGFGPAALPVLRKALKKAGLKFKK